MWLGEVRSAGSPRPRFGPARHRAPWTVVTESFLTIPALVAGTRRIALLQERLVRALTADLGVRTVPCPFDAGPLVDAMWWHPVYDRDPEHAFFRNLMVRAAASADDEG